MARRWAVIGFGVAIALALWSVRGSSTSVLLAVVALLFVPLSVLSVAMVFDFARRYRRRKRRIDDEPVEDISAQRQLWIGFGAATILSFWVSSFPGLGAGGVLIAVAAGAWVVLAFVWLFDVMCAMESHRRLTERVVFPAVAFVVIVVISLSGATSRARFRLSEGSLDRAANHAITNGSVPGHVAGYRVSQVWVDFDRQMGAVGFETPGGIMSPVYFVRATSTPPATDYACDHLDANWYLCSNAED